MKMFTKSLFSLLRLILLIAALLMGGVAFFRTGGFSGIKWDLNDIKTKFTNEFSNLSSKLETQTKSAKDIAQIQTLILKAKLAIIENKDLKAASGYLANAQEMLAGIKKESAEKYGESIDNTTKKINELAGELKNGVYVSSNKFEEILLNLDIMDKTK
ncbi:hypothetical protein KKB18_00975 [bacterium]|nr:hypothetical protein [bacterium]